jgi:hypothetical protein
MEVFCDNCRGLDTEAKGVNGTLVGIPLVNMGNESSGTSSTVTFCRDLVGAEDCDGRTEIDLMIS